MRWRGWLTDAAVSKDKYSSITNIGDAEKTFAASWQALGITPKKAAVRDLWKREDMGELEGVS